MLTLTRAKLTRGNMGEPLPTVFESLAAEGIHFRRGQFSLIAAAPGVGKSILALTVSLRAGSPGYYASADTDAHTTYLRAGAMLTGWSTSDIEHAVTCGNTADVDARLNALSFVRMDFAGRVEIDSLEADLKAYAMVYGEWPHFIVIDNLSNLDSEGDRFQALEYSCDYLHELGRKTGAAVIALHHVTGEYDDGIRPVPLSGLRGKISKVPEMILTLHRSPDSTRLFVCPVKNRSGRNAAAATWNVALAYDLPRMRITDALSDKEGVYA
ncbi:AAA family ATPase [Micromonospora sp. WMMA1363]|uniref:AAA family ATPase n=1 Tax=Micromonospora sp. WMMA1363 TaxID=3053985 RepID=UPI00259D1A72|nr:AAA family ATPase [Micromonospora sp. WMMA1363]MDM4721871.1 AAA family ATPase [Micromonospora sp. WMMA1363]